MKIFLKENLKALRSIVRLNQQEFGSLFGLGDSTYGNYETGYTKQPDLLVVKKIADHFGVLVDELLYMKLDMTVIALKMKNNVRNYQEVEMPATNLQEPLVESPYSIGNYLEAVIRIYRQDIDRLNQRVTELEKEMKILRS